MRRRRTTSEELELWRRTVLDVRPLAHSPAVIDAPPPPDPDLRVYHPRSARIIAPSKPDRERRASSAPVFGAGDPAVDRRLARRRTSIDRVLDLHGMTQEQAHSRLRSFVSAAYGANERRLLVVTGKGGPASASAMTRLRVHAAAPRGAGILRTRFLDWVEEPDLRSLIARVSQAAPRDGGAGAFYIFLKRPG